MSKLRQRMTPKELRQIVEDYHRAFPDWYILGGELLGRDNGPVMQIIGFERLSTGSYRPVGGIYYLCVPDRDGRFGHQFLTFKQSIHPNVHESVRNNVVEAIRKEILPSVDKDLNPEEVLQMHEASQFIRSSDAHHLAALNACLSHDERALYWCSQFPRLVEQSGRGWQESDQKRRAFLDQLEIWLHRGEAKQQLERIVQSERRKWGLI